MIKMFLNQQLDAIKNFIINGYGKKTKTTLYENVPCRWQEIFSTVLNRQGEEVVSKIQCWLSPHFKDATISINKDMIFTYGGIDYEIITFVNEVDILGHLEYIKVFLE